MTLLVIGLVLFIGIHLMPSVFPLRKTLFEQLGEKQYKIFYSLISLLGLGLIIYGKAEANFVHVWAPPLWTRYLAWVCMVPALFLVIAAETGGNIKRFTPHPMMWGVLIWSAAHLTANGDLASIMLFGAFAFLSVTHIITANMRGAARETEIKPIAADVRTVIATVVVYAAIGVAHPYLFKMPAFLF